MKQAWAHVKELALSMSKALSLAWKNIKAKAQMLAKIVTITFRKKDGTIRVATATLNPSLMPASSSQSTHTRKSNDSVQVFWDIDKMAYRSYIKSNLMSIG